MEFDVSENNRRIVKNTLYIYIRMFVTLAISLFTARIVYNTLGIDNYGIYNVVGCIIVFFTFINEGLSGATRRYLTAELAQGNLFLQRKIFSIAIKAHAIIALIIFIGGESIGLWILNYILNIPESRMFAANVVYQLSVISAALGIMQSPFGAAIVANERMSIYAYFSVLDVIFKLVIIYLVQYISGDKLIIYALLIFVISIIEFLIYRIYCYRIFPMCHYINVKDHAILKSMFMYMGWSLFGQAAYVGTNQGVSMLINVYYNVAVNAAMGVSNTIVNIVGNFAANLQVAFKPQITKYYISHSIEELNKLTIRASRYSSYLLLILMVPICFEIKDFLIIWLGNYPKYAIEFCILTLLCIYFESICGPLITLITSDKNIKEYQVITSIFYSSNILFCWIVLANGFEPYFVIIVRLFVDVLLIGVRLYLMKGKFYDFPIRQWLFSIIVKNLLIIIFPVFFTWMLTLLIINNIWVRLFIIVSFSFVLMCTSVYLIGLTSREKELVIKKFKGKLVK